MAGEVASQVTLDPEQLFTRYQELQAYVDWTAEDAARVQSLQASLDPLLSSLIDDFYEEISKHAGTRRVLTGGDAQVRRLKITLQDWLRNLLRGKYDREYVTSRWRVGRRHVEIGLDQVYTNVALSRLRRGLMLALEQLFPNPTVELLAARRSLNTVLDLDLAIIEDAYQAEHLSQQKNLERRAASRRVAEERERSEVVFQTLVETAPCLIILLDQEKRVLYFSRYAQELTGFEARAVCGHCIFDILAGGENRLGLESTLDAVLEGRSYRGFSHPLRCADDTQRWLVWNLEKLPDFSGKPSILIVAQDITPLKEAEEQALQAERLAAIGQMMTGLAHESGNALARSQSCLEMLTWEVEDRPEAMSLIQRVQNALDHLRQLYEEVKAYAAPIRLDRQPWNLSMVWRQAWENLALVRKDKVAQLVEETDGTDLTASVDPFRLDQVFRNLLENALAASKEPIRIVVRAKTTTLGGKDALEVSVRDNGPGLTPEAKKRIFEPFFTTKSKGTGLGMAIAKRVVEAHHGQIFLGPATGEGAEILITLPRELS